MIFDAHVHIKKGAVQPEWLMQSMSRAKIFGAVLISQCPEEDSSNIRISNMMEWTMGYKTLHPFYWINPRDKDAPDQVNAAVEAGAAGFKIICDSFYPGDDKCLLVCEIIAGLEKPVLFHSGILWDGKPSSEFCRPVHFESLLQVEGLKFSLAHIGWPWVDEMIAVYGKFLNFRTRNHQSKTEMFIDMTPGTPLNYRKYAIEKLIGTGYDVIDNLLFGSDCNANDYNHEWSEKWISTDNDIFTELGISSEERLKIFSGNTLRFLGKGEEKSFNEQKPAEF